MITVVRSYKYRIHPNKTQERALQDIRWAACTLYNSALAYRRKRWQESRHNANYYELAALWRDWRNEDGDENPLRVLNQSAGQQVLRRLDSAYREFMNGKRGRPRFKRLDRFHSIPYVFGNGASIKDGRLYIQNAGLIKVRWHRDLPAGSSIKQIIVTERNGRWHATIQLEMQIEPPKMRAVTAVGIDMGISHALALSNGEFIDSPRHLEQSLAKLRVLQRTVARQKKGSKRRKKAVQQLARLHEKIANRRRDFWHKTTRRLVDEYGTIAIEDLHLGFMLQNGKLSRAAHDTSLGMFRELLAYKAIEAGSEVIAVNPRNTSQACSGCGEIVANPLRVRTHNCPCCGLVMDRDTNAAVNVLKLAGAQPTGANVGRYAARCP